MFDDMTILQIWQETIQDCLEGECLEYNGKLMEANIIALFYRRIVNGPYTLIENGIIPTELSIIIIGFIVGSTARQQQSCQQ